ncbi:histidinol-phosphatase [Siccirubricoccus sp. G192]|uniref:histidinol-phosphatase n=1 Tax=Siccirubricoccus sp. G192 TaxID=2849651 RepID=UPI001C2BB6E3|nr:histidinol-phosphatase [Siccirubricoccus sp. G192]MBV1796170.1 histidinol-phosphatase [Siccirubricoccus sp. G192]
MAVAGPELLAAAEAAADAAGAVIRPLFRSALLVEAKGDASPVTEADRQAECAMRALLRQRFPDHGLWGEEFGADRADAEFLWVLDPIDGTRAFVTGRPLFGTLIGLLHRGRPVLGLIDQPVTGERWIGLAGEATRFRSPLGGTPRCRPCPRLAEAELSCTSPDMFTPADRPGFERLRGAARRVTWGGDCYAYGLLALGLVDVVAESTMKPWDWAALVPVVEGAGGCVTGWDGRPLTLESDGRVLALGDPALLPEATALLMG